MGCRAALSFLDAGRPLSGLWLFVAVVFFAVGLTFALMGYLAMRDREKERPKEDKQG